MLPSLLRCLSRHSAVTAPLLSAKSAATETPAPVRQCRRGYAGPSSSSSAAAAGTAGAAKKLKGKGVAAISSKKELEVETDAKKLISHLCINYYVDGEFAPLKPPEAYPDWLWELSTEMEPRPLTELEPNSEAYWRHVIDAKMKEAFKLGKMDGWIKAEHMRDENHLERFYGPAYQELLAHEAAKADQVVAGLVGDGSKKSEKPQSH